MLPGLHRNSPGSYSAVGVLLDRLAADALVDGHVVRRASGDDRGLRHGLAIAAQLLAPRRTAPARLASPSHRWTPGARLGRSCCASTTPTGRTPRRSACPAAWRRPAARLPLRFRRPATSSHPWTRWTSGSSCASGWAHGALRTPPPFSTEPRRPALRPPADGDLQTRGLLVRSGRDRIAVSNDASAVPAAVGLAADGPEPRPAHPRRAGPPLSDGDRRAVRRCRSPLDRTSARWRMSAR